MYTLPAEESIPSPFAVSNAAYGSSSPAIPDDVASEIDEHFGYRFDDTPTEDEIVTMYLDSLIQQHRAERRDGLKPLPTSTLLAWAARPELYRMRSETVEDFAADVADELQARGVTAVAA